MGDFMHFDSSVTNSVIQQMPQATRSALQSVLGSCDVAGGPCASHFKFP